MVEVFHEWIGVVLFHVPDAGFAPASGEHLLGADHGWDSGGVGNGLGANFLKACFVIADVVDVDGLGLAVFDAGDNVRDTRAAFGAFPKVARIWEDGF